MARIELHAGVIAKLSDANFVQQIHEDVVGLPVHFLQRNSLNGAVIVPNVGLEGIFVSMPLAVHRRKLKEVPTQNELDAAKRLLILHLRRFLLVL